MLLSVQERLGVLELLPREGDYAALKELRVARECLALTPEEMAEFEYTETPSGVGVQIRWNQEKAVERDIPLDQYATDVIRNALIKLEADKKLTDKTFSLYGKFAL